MLILSKHSNRRNTHYKTSCSDTAINHKSQQSVFCPLITFLSLLVQDTPQNSNEANHPSSLERKLEESQQRERRGWYSEWPCLIIAVASIDEKFHHTAQVVASLVVSCILIGDPTTCLEQLTCLNKGCTLCTCSLSPATTHLP